MIKPPSNQKTYDVFFTRDAAIVSLPDEASDTQKAEHGKAIERALETGEWGDVTIPGEQPTRFVFKPLGCEIAGELYAMMSNSQQHFTVFALAFRLALVNVKNLPDAGKVDFVINPTFGRMATTAFLDRAGLKGEIGAAIIVELGAYALKRARGDDPKS